MKKVYFHPDYDYTPQQLADICQVDRRTAMRWCQQKQSMHKAYRRLVEYHRAGLVLPDNRHLSVAQNQTGLWFGGEGGEYIDFDEIVGMWLTRQEMGRLKRENEILHHKLAQAQSELQKTAASDTTTPTMTLINTVPNYKRNYQCP